MKTIDTSETSEATLDLEDLDFEPECEDECCTVTAEWHGTSTCPCGTAHFACDEHRREVDELIAEVPGPMCLLCKARPVSVEWVHL